RIEYTRTMRFLPVSAIVFLAFVIGSCSAYKARQDRTVLSAVPTIDQVGAAAMPAEIAPIKAPFPMPQLKRPQFPARTLNITDKGAVQHKLATKQIQAAIDEVNRLGGGTVIIPP